MGLVHDLTPEHVTQLREPFKPEQMGKLPRATKKDAKKGNCAECGKYHGLPAIHLDYVGHAAVTQRLLEVDPFWNWEPMSFDEHGAPYMERDDNGYPRTLWIRLTIRNVTRVGVGTVEPGKVDPEKQLIGDALRNAAMRFGVALDLWSKEDLREGEDHGREAPRRSRRPAASRPAETSDVPTGGGPTCGICSKPIGTSPAKKTPEGYVHKACLKKVSESPDTHSDSPSSSADAQPAQESPSSPCEHCGEDPCECAPA